MKYIVYKTDRKFEEIILFSENVTHSEMANFLKKEVISAGFVCITNNYCHCYGKSISLDLSSRKEDTILLRKAVYGDMYDCVEYNEP